MTEKTRLPKTCVNLLDACGRRSLRRRILLNMLSHLALLIGLPLAAFLLDYHLDLPVPVRAVLILGLLVVWGRHFSLRLLAAFRHRPDRQQLARSIERHQPGLNGILLTAVQLSESGNPAAEYVSPILIDQVRKQAGGAVKDVDLTGLYSKRPFVRPASLLGVLVLVWGMVGILRSDVLPVWGARLLMQDMPWPKSVVITLEKPASSPVMLAEGDDLMVQVKLERGDVRKVELVCSWPSGTQTRKVMTRWGGDMFRHTLPNLTRPFSFHAEGGDGRTIPVEVAISVRPRVERIEAEVQYPEYTGKGNDISRDGTIKALIGSRVSYRAWIQPPVDAAACRIYGSGEENPYEDQTLTIAEDADMSLVTGTFTVTRSGYYTFALTGREGFENRNAARFRIRAMQDAVPRVQITEPPAKEECTRTAVVAVKGIITDDWSVDRASLMYRVRFDPEKDQDPGPEQSRSMTLTEKGGKIPLDDQWRLSDITLKAGSTILWQVAATDLAGGTGRSPEQVLVIVRPEDLKKILFDRLNMVREDIRSLKELQLRSVKRTRELVKATQDMDTLDARAAGVLSQSGADERALANRLGRVAGRLTRIQERMVRNAVGDLKDRRWIKNLADEVAGLVSDRVTPLIAELKSLVESAGAGNASPVALSGIQSAQQVIADKLEDLEDRMAQFGDLNLIIRRLKDILANEEEVRSMTKELLGDE